MFKQFGGSVTDALQAQYEQSPQWKDSKFENLEETSMDISFQNLPSLLYKQIFDTNGRNPEQSLPIADFDKDAFLAPADKAKFIWYGHSVILLRMAGKTILIDPMLGPNAAPIAPFPVKRFSPNTLDLINDFPDLDLVIMTHDHYDHLDYASIKRLKDKTGHFFVALGVKRHLVEWGIAAEKVTEFDWWDDTDWEGIKITFTPTRHFSGRGLRDRAKSLWGGWAFQTQTESLYFSGDGGYGDHFKEVGAKLGPFDFGFMECGQYNEHWHAIHMYPEECVQAAFDAGVQRAMPVHWAGFALALHTWQEPADRFLAEVKAKNLPYTLPELGRLYSVEEESTHAWWEGMA